jgi:nucleotide-binding universal stress UspA family protein
LDADAVTGGPAEAKRSPRAEGQAASREALETARQLADAAAALGVDARTVKERSFAFGLPEVVADHARLHDVVVAGVDRAGLLSERAMAEPLVFRAGRPVVVPAAHETSFRCERIAVGWDNSRAAARALGDAMPLLQRAREVALVTGGEEKKIDASLGNRELVEALSRRGVTARTKCASLSGSSIGEALGRAAQHDAADLLVMGAFGHSRLSVVKEIETVELKAHRRVLAHRIDVMLLGRDGSSGGFGWSAS